MINRNGWKLFFFLTLIYLLFGILGLVQATQQTLPMTSQDILGWVFTLIFAVLTATASYGYAWNKVVGFGRFWYLLLVVSLTAVTYEVVQLYQATDTENAEKLFVAIVGGIYFSFFTRLMLKYAAEDRKSANNTRVN